MNNTIVHIAGVVIHVGDRVIQRCSLCGEKLCDNARTSAPLNEDGSVPKFPTWEVGRLIQVTAMEGCSRSVVLPDAEKLPEDSCYDLVEV